MPILKINSRLTQLPDHVPSFTSLLAPPAKQSFSSYFEPFLA
jgi:hypothetical protein